MDGPRSCKLDEGSRQSRPSIYLLCARGKSSSSYSQASFLISHPHPTVGQSYSRRCPTTEPCQKVCIVACTRVQSTSVSRYSEVPPLVVRCAPPQAAPPPRPSQAHLQHRCQAAVVQIDWDETLLTFSISNRGSSCLSIQVTSKVV